MTLPLEQALGQQLMVAFDGYEPSAEILGQLAKGLRISAESLYVRAGILEEREDQMPLETAVLAEVGLTERQKRVLLDIYESFRAENARMATVYETVDPAPKPRSVRVAAARQAAATTKATKATKKNPLVLSQL